MPDDNRFESISSQLDEEPDDSDDEPATAVETTDPGLESAREQPTSDTTGSGNDEPADEDDDPMSTPAFEYDKVKKNSVYPRADTWEDFDAAITLAKGRLRTEHDISAVEKRELHEAALAEIAENPDRLVKRMLELRGIEE